MADRISFQLDLTGSMAAALGPVNRELAVLIPGLDDTRHKMDGLPAIVFDVGRAFEWAAAAIMKGASALAEFGRFLLQTAAEKQSLDLALKFNTGAQAPAFQALADSYGNTGKDDGEILAAQMGLFQIGVKNEDLIANLTTAAIDLEALSAGQVKFGEVLDSFAKAARKGEISDKVLAPLKLGTADYFNALGEALGVSAAKAEELNKAGKVQAEDSLKVLLGIIQEREGGSIGGPSLEAGKTIGATLHRLENLPGNMFKVLADTPAMRGVQDAIEAFIEEMQGPKGAALVEKIGKGLDNIFGNLSIERLSEILDQTIEVFTVLAGAVSFLGDALGVAWKLLLAVGDALGWVAAQAFLAFEEFTRDMGIMWRGITRFADEAVNLGASIVAGIVDGITGAMGTLSDAVSSIGDSVIGWFKDKLGIHSPSTVFRDLGAQTGEGFALGLEDVGDRVTGATRSMLARGGARGGGSGVVGGSSVTNHLEFHITGGNASDIGDEVVRRVETFLAQHYDRALLEAGA